MTKPKKAELRTGTVVLLVAIAVLDDLLLRCDREQDEAKRRELLAMTAVVGTYIKRCGNLVFIRESSADAETQELARCFEEYFSSLELLGVTYEKKTPVIEQSLQKIYKSYTFG